MTQYCVGLVQATNVYSDTCFFPYTIGVLQAHFQKHGRNAEQYRFLELVYRMEPVDILAERLAEADLVGFSTYIWNKQFSLALAKRLKALQPRTLIFFGGPEVPKDPEPFLRDHPWIDLACEGEGEESFRQVLEHLDDRDFSAIPGVSWRDGDIIRHTPRTVFCKDLATHASPYLEGVFDPLMTGDRGHRWDGIWETNRGCPFRCGYCCWGASPLKRIIPFPMERLLAEIDWFARNKIRFIYLTDSNFGILKRDLDLSRELARVKGLHGFPTFVSANFMKSPDPRALEICRILEDSKLSRGVTIGLQSTCAEALENVGRKNIPAAQLRELQTLLNRDNIITYVDMILGLPGETYDSFVNGIEEIIMSRQANHVQFNNLVLLPNSRLYEPEAMERFAMETQTLDSLNLHSTDFYLVDNIRERKELVVGTYSMSQTDWVRSRVYAWMAAFLYFNKMLQIPLVLATQHAGLPFRACVEAFMDPEMERWPLLSRLRDLLFSFAERIRSGGDEFCKIPELMDTYWTQDEYLMILLSQENLLDDFYAESLSRLEAILAENGQEPCPALAASVELNHRLLKQPFQTEDIRCALPYDIWGAYRDFLEGRPVSPEPTPVVYRIARARQHWDDWAQWAKEVVWYEHRLGAYFYDITLETVPEAATTGAP